MKSKIFQILGVVAITSLGLVSCNTDECKDVTCDNGGICVEGTCECLDGYEGTNCETEERAKFTGTYVYGGTFVCPVTGDGTISDEPMTVTSSSTDVTRITVDFGFFILTGVVSGTSLTMDAATVGGLDYTGTGSVNGNTLSITLNEVEPNVETCIYTLTAVKQ